MDLNSLQIALSAMEHRFAELLTEDAPREELSSLLTLIRALRNEIEVHGGKPDDAGSAGQ
jgi:hypothetical protein